MIWPRPTMYHIDLYIGNRESAAIMPTLEPQCCCPDKNRLVFLWVCTIERSIVGINGIQWVQRGFAAFFIIKMFPRSVFQYVFLAAIWPRPTMYHIDLYIGNRESAAIMPTLEPQCCCPDKNRLVFLWVRKIERSTVGINGIQWGQCGYPFVFTWCQVAGGVFTNISAKTNGFPRTYPVR